MGGADLMGLLREKKFDEAMKYFPSSAGTVTLLTENGLFVGIIFF